MLVLVLLSTYNGERYLKEQIDSILAQEGVGVHILVRDDGSKDRTCEILEEYDMQHDNVDVVRADNVGFVKSFSKLVEMAQKYKDLVDYYAFSDQDDVWMPHKLKTACDCLSKMNQDKPLLFSSNSVCVDENLNILKQFHKSKPYRTKENVMIYPTEQGCSMVFNKKAVELYNMHSPITSWHDRWMCMICNCFGELYYSHEALFYYRIHSSNTLGVRKSLLKTYFDDIFDFFFTTPLNYGMVKEFYDGYKDKLDAHNNQMVVEYLSYSDSIRQKIKMIFLSKYQYSFAWHRRLRNSLLIIFNKR